MNELPPLPERNPEVPAEQQGMFRKFEVYRTDRSDAGPGCKHYGCDYFVLDTTHDQHAKAALTAYADAVESTHPELAADMRARYSLAALAAQPGAVGELWGVDANKLLANAMKPSEIAGPADAQRRRVGELLSWFARLADGQANPKWTTEHAFELAYYIAAAPTEAKPAQDTVDAWEGVLQPLEDKSRGLVEAQYAAKFIAEIRAAISARKGGKP